MSVRARSSTDRALRFGRRGWGFDSLRAHTMNWFIYIAQCKDGSLYTGITTNLTRRELEHNTSDKLGAKSLRGKRPIKIIYNELHNSESEAKRREAEIKKLSRKDKLTLTGR